MHSIIFLLIFLTGHVLSRETDFCFAEDDEPYLYMATKTAYHFVRSGKTGFQTVPNCLPLQIWMVAVHGTRYPNINEIDQMSSLLELRDHIVRNHETRSNGRLCNRDLENLKRWGPESHLTMQMAEVLTPQGIEDMKLLAARLQSKFPELLQPNGNDITSANYKFRTTVAQSSMEYFMEGLFGSRAAILPEQSSVNDTLLSTYKTCNLWDDKQDKDIINNEEQMNFDSGPEFDNLVRNISGRLGFLYNISANSVITMYNMCRYEKAWSVTQLSPWCAVFSKDELRILEYREDLIYYHNAGYGRDINARLGCPLLQNMMHHFWKLAQEEVSDEPRGFFYFTDVVNFQNLLTTLGIAKDSTQLTAFNYKEMARRQWRTSFISSFAANLVAVFYRCDDNKEPNKVMFYLAEKPVLLEGCEVGLCDWEYMKARYGALAADCKLDVCRQNNGAVSFYTSLFAFLFSCLSLVSFRY